MIHLVISIALLFLTLYRVYRAVSRRKTALNLSDQTILITGGCSGLGKVLANTLAKAGAKVIVADIQPRPKDLHQDVLVFETDVSNDCSIERLKSELKKINIMPGIIINNAGIQNGGRLLVDLSSEDVSRIVGTNLIGPISITRAFLPHLSKDAEKPCHIVNIASCLGLGGLNNFTDYCATKFGLVGFSEALRLELKLTTPNVMVTTVCPFLIKTGMFPQVRIAHPWLTPALEPEQIASAIIDAIKYRDAEEIWLPAFLHLFPFLRLLPCSVYDRVQMILGSCSSVNIK